MISRVLHALSLSSLSLAQVLSNSVKQKRAEKAGKWSVPLPKVKPVADDEMFKIMQSGKRKGRKLITTCFAFSPINSAPFNLSVGRICLGEEPTGASCSLSAPWRSWIPSWIHAYNLLTTSCPFYSEILEADGNEGHLCGRKLYAQGSQVSRERGSEREGSRRVWRRDQGKSGGLRWDEGMQEGDRMGWRASDLIPL